jgi:hypothetical protein
MRRLFNLYLFTGSTDANLTTYHRCDAHGLRLLKLLACKSTLEHGSPRHLSEHSSLICLTRCHYRAFSRWILLCIVNIFLDVFQANLLSWTSRILSLCHELSLVFLHEILDFTFILHGVLTFVTIAAQRWYIVRLLCTHVEVLGWALIINPH